MGLRQVDGQVGKDGSLPHADSSGGAEVLHELLEAGSSEPPLERVTPRQRQRSGQEQTLCRPVPLTHDRPSVAVFRITLGTGLAPVTIGSLARLRLGPLSVENMAASQGT